MIYHSPRRRDGDAFHSLMTDSHADAYRRRGDATRKKRCRHVQPFRDGVGAINHDLRKEQLKQQPPPSLRATSPIRDLSEITRPPETVITYSCGGLSLSRDSRELAERFGRAEGGLRAVGTPLADPLIP